MKKYKEKLWDKYSFIIILLFILLTNLYSCSKWNTTIGGPLTYIVELILFFSVLNRGPLKRKRNKYVPTIVKLLMITPLLCFFTKIFYSNDSLLDERYSYSYVLILILYFYLYYKHCTETVLIRTCTFISLLMFLIQVVQQIFPTHAIFGIYSDFERNLYNIDGLVEIRNGLYRYRIIGESCTLLCLFYFWQKLIENFKSQYLIFFLIFLSSIYLCLTRQLMVASIVCFIVSILWVKNYKTKIWMIVLIIVGAFVLISFYNVLFKEFFERTLDETNEDNIRLLCANFYWDKTTQNFSTLFLGSGHPSGLHKWAYSYGYFTLDIGILGELYHYGIIHILVYFYTIYLVLFKYSNHMPPYIKLFVFEALVTNAMMFPYSTGVGYLIWTIVLYIVSIRLDRCLIKHC